MGTTRAAIQHDQQSSPTLTQQTPQGQTAGHSQPEQVSESSPPLHRYLGNSYVHAMTTRTPRLVLQTQLTVNEPGDIYEREADRVADQVMAAPTHANISNAPLQIQRFAGPSPGQTEAAPASVGKALASPGRPLEAALRQDLERRFGYDFAAVRVHTGAAAAQSAQDVHANAYTVGHDIVFDAGRFAPGTAEGRRLIAHELTHVVQQSSADVLHISQTNGIRGPAHMPTVLHASPKAVARQAKKPARKVPQRGSYFVAATEGGGVLYTFNGEDVLLWKDRALTAFTYYLKDVFPGVTEQIAASMAVKLGIRLSSVPDERIRRDKYLLVNFSANEHSNIVKGMKNAYPQFAPINPQLGNRDLGGKGASGVGGSKSASAKKAEGQATTGTGSTEPALTAEDQQLAAELTELMKGARSAAKVDPQEMVRLYKLVKEAVKDPQFAESGESFVHFARFLEENKDKIQGIIESGPQGNLTQEKIAKIIAEYQKYTGAEPIEKDAGEKLETVEDYDKEFKYDPGWQQLSKEDRKLLVDFAKLKPEEVTDKKVDFKRVTTSHKVSMALKLSDKSFLGEFREAAEQAFTDPTVIITLIVTMAIYVGLWLTPDPSVITKAAAAALTVVLLAHFTWDVIIGTVRAWYTLQEECKHATNVAQLRAAGDKFLKKLGKSGFDVLMFIVMWRVGKRVKAKVQKIGAQRRAARAAKKPTPADTKAAVAQQAAAPSASAKAAPPGPSKATAPDVRPAPVEPTPSRLTPPRSTPVRDFTPPEVIPPEVIPLEVTPPAVMPLEVIAPRPVPPRPILKPTPVELTPPGLTPPRLTPPGLTPPALTPPGLTPPGLTPPGLTPPGLTAPRLTPPALTPPGLTPPVASARPPTRPTFSWWQRSIINKLLALKLKTVDEMLGIPEISGRIGLRPPSAQTVKTPSSAAPTPDLPARPPAPSRAVSAERATPTPSSQPRTPTPPSTSSRSATTEGTVGTSAPATPTSPAATGRTVVTPAPMPAEANRPPELPPDIGQHPATGQAPQAGEAGSTPVSDRIRAIQEEQAERAKTWEQDALTIELGTRPDARARARAADFTPMLPQWEAPGVSGRKERFERLINARLAREGIPPVQVKWGNQEPGYAEFDFSEWVITLSEKAVSANRSDKDFIAVVASLVENTVHEEEHTVTTFRGIRVALEDRNYNPSTDVPDAVLAQAIAANDRKLPSAELSPEALAEAREIYQLMFAQDQRRATLGTVDVVDRDAVVKRMKATAVQASGAKVIYDFYAKEVERLAADGKHGSAEYAQAQRDATDAYQAWERALREAVVAHNAYVAGAEETVSWRKGLSVKAAFLELIPLESRLRDLRQQYERATVEQSRKRQGGDREGADAALQRSREAQRQIQETQAELDALVSKAPRLVGGRIARQNQPLTENEIKNAPKAPDSGYPAKRGSSTVSPAPSISKPSTPPESAQETAPVTPAPLPPQKPSATPSQEQGRSVNLNVKPRPGKKPTPLSAAAGEARSELLPPVSPSRSQPTTSPTAGAVEPTAPPPAAEAPAQQQWEKALVETLKNGGGKVGTGLITVSGVQFLFPDVTRVGRELQMTYLAINKVAGPKGAGMEVHDALERALVRIAQQTDASSVRITVEQVGNLHLRRELQKREYAEASSHEDPDERSWAKVIPITPSSPGTDVPPTATIENPTSLESTSPHTVKAPTPSSPTPSVPAPSRIINNSTLSGTAPSHTAPVAVTPFTPPGPKRVLEAQDYNVTPLQEGTNLGKLIVQHKATGKKSLFKPATGEKEIMGSNVGIVAGDRYRRAPAAAYLARQAGIETPAAEMMIWRENGKEVIGSLQEWTEEGKAAAEFHGQPIYNTITRSQPKRDLDAFDYVIANMDRNVGNWKVVLDPQTNQVQKVIPIDMDASLPPGPERYSLGRVFPPYQQPMPDTISRGLYDRLLQMSANRATIEKELRAFLRQAEIDGVFTRLGQVLESVLTGNIDVVP